MDKETPRHAMPTFRSARILGIFNVNFGTLLFIGGLFMGGYLATIPLWGRLFSELSRQAERQAEARRVAESKAIAEAERKAETVEEKIDAAARRKAFEDRPKFANPALMVDFSRMGFNDPFMIGWSWAEIATGLGLNVLLIVSGVGLISWKPWAHKLALATATMKILRLFVLYGLFIVVVVPPISKSMGAMVGEMMSMQQAGGGGSPISPEMFSKVYAVMYTIIGVGVIVMGSIYPAIMLWILTRPGVKSACSGVFQLPREPRQPC